MLDLYKIDGTINNDGHSCYNDPNTFPNFQEKLNEFKQFLIRMVDEKHSATIYKFGDGDGRFLNQVEVGSAKPGNRALSKQYGDIDMSQYQRGAQLCSHYTCELYPENISAFKSVIHRQIDFPAEFGYGLIANNWLLQTFEGRIGIIGADKKIDLIEELMGRDEYRNYLGINGFEDYIRIPQKFAADDLDGLKQSLKSQLSQSTADIFILGVGHVKSGLLHELTTYKSGVYLDVGGGIDMIAGVINTNRPYAGAWTNYKLKDYDYSGIDYMNYNRGNELWI